MAAPIRIANCSGYYGDRLSAAREMVDGGPIDVLTGDWLAELTMLILARGRAKNPQGGFARTFLTQMEQVMGTCLDRGIKVVANAGGLDPAGCAAAVDELAARLGLSPCVGYVEGDDLMGRLGELRAAGHRLDNLDTGEALGDREVLTANAYLGAFGIVEALARGADIVVTGRTTDAAVVAGPAAWHHGWGRGDFGPLAGAIAAGHVIECGTQATGGNYPFFEEVPGLEHPGFPIAEIAADGSSVITKHGAHGGLVSVGTVTAQLLYEIGGPRYLNPDVTTRFDTIRLRQVAPDRVAMTGVRGEPPPSTSKVCVNLAGGLKSTLTFLLAGLDIDAKADLLERSLWAALPGGRAGFAATEVELLRTDHADPASNEAAFAQLRVSVKDPDPSKHGRALTGPVNELYLASYPGFFGAIDQGPVSYGVYWPALLPADLLHHEVVVGGRRTVVDAAAPGTAVPAGTGTVASNEGLGMIAAVAPDGPMVRIPLGRIAGARSGDKGGNANVGVWVRTAPKYEWLAGELTVDRFRELVVEAAGLPVHRYELPNLLALNFVVEGFLGEGVASSTRIDAQAKSLGEYLRAKLIDVPTELVDPQP